MNQENINQNEWNAPENWTLLTYRSQRDSRLFVPKRRGWGWTINFGNKKGVRLCVALLAIPLIILIILKFAM